MSILMVVNDPGSWPLSIPGVEVVSARRYLTDPAFHRMADTRVFNLCESYSYQSRGYYVSLLAEARGHRPQPDIVTIQDMKSSPLVRAIAEDLDELIQKTLRTVPPGRFELSIYFGKTTAQRDQQLGHRLCGRFPSPLLRAQFIHRNKWHLHSIRPIPANEIPDSHHSLVVEAAQEYFARRYRSMRTAQPPRYTLAILHDPAEPAPPSDPGAIRKFVRAAARLDVATELITKDDSAHLGEFDALFIRATTFVNHYTYRFARRAVAEGLPVIDDPQSIARCTNKVYLAELLRAHGVPTPRTVVLRKDGLADLESALSWPIVLKIPDGSFSRGVHKAHDRAALEHLARRLFEESDLILAQEYVPTAFDWRVGVLNKQPIFVCQYFMSKRHWQIVDHRGTRPREGATRTLGVEQAPPAVVRTALRAANLIGDGLYGVDLKETARGVVVIEVNDNPNVDGAVEGAVLGDALYRRIMEEFVRRLDARRLRANGPAPAALDAVSGRLPRIVRA